MRWNLIETATKDRKARLVWCPMNKNIYLAAWFEGDDSELAGWAVFGSYRHILREPVTHWMPVPEPPPASEEMATMPIVNW